MRAVDAARTLGFGAGLVTASLEDEPLKTASFLSGVAIGFARRPRAALSALGFLSEALGSSHPLSRRFETSRANHTLEALRRIVDTAHGRSRAPESQGQVLSRSITLLLEGGASGGEARRFELAKALERLTGKQRERLLL